MHLDLAVHDASDKSMDVGEDDVLVDPVLLPKLLERTVGWKIDSTKFGLHDDGAFVSWQSNVNFDRELDARSRIQRFQKRLFACPNAHLGNLVG